MRTFPGILAPVVLIPVLLGCSGSTDQTARERLTEAPRANPPRATAAEPADSPATAGREPEQQVSPTFELPLEYHFDPPPVPKRIRGPSPPISDRPA